MSNFSERYNKIWQTFTEEISKLSSDVIDSIGLESGTSFHDLLKSLQGVPYMKAPALFAGLSGSNTDVKRENIGSVTGVFFEIMTASIIKGYFKKYLPEAMIELNSCSNKAVSEIARDPDIFIHYNGYYVVFETKTSPKKRDLEYVCELHDRYLKLENINYYVIGGRASVNRSLLEKLAKEKWICLISTSERNNDALKEFPDLDELLKESVQFLRNS